MTKTNKYIQIISFIVGIALLSISSGVFAVTASETTTVTATVPSKACPQFTIISTNVPEALADNSQKILVTVLLKDCEEAILPDTLVTLTTNRGAVDHADFVTASGEVLTQGYGTGVNGNTNAEGVVYFNLYTEVPGEVTVFLKADNLILLGTKQVKFLALPFPKNISISVTIPPIIGKIIPGYNEKKGTLPIFVPENQQFDDAKIVNMGVDLRLPFWLFLLLTLILIAIPVLSTTNIFLLRRIRKEQNLETSKIEAEVEEIHEELQSEICKTPKEPKNPSN